MAAVAVTSANSNYITNADRVCVRTSAGIPYVIVWNISANDIEIYKGNSSTPTSFSEQDAADAPAAAVYGCASAAIDSTGIIHIVYMSYISKSDDLIYITYNTSTDQWGAAATINSDLGAESTSLSNLFTSIAIDSNDIPHVAYVGVESSAGTIGYVTRYENRIGGAWIGTGVEVEGQTANKDCRYPSIAINASNVPVITYLNDDDDDLAYAYGNANDATSFTITDIDASAASSQKTSICVDSSGNVYKAGVDSDNTIMVYDNSNTQRDTGYTGSSPSLVTKGTDIYIFYEDANNDIAYTKSTDAGVNWSAAVVLESGTYNTPSARWSKYASFNASPTVVLNDPTAGETITDTTPDLTFTGTDSDTYIDYVFADETASPDIQWNTLTVAGDEIEYNVQVDTSTTFESQGSIVVGTVPVDGSNTASVTWTTLNKDIVSTISGTITCVRLWANIDLVGCKVGTFYGSGTSWQVRDYETIGSVASGSVQTFSSLSIAVQTGDLIGIYGTSGAIELISTGHSGIIAYTSGDAFSGGPYTFSLLGAGTESMSLCGYEITPAPIISKLSVTPDATFTDVTDGTDTHPFDSGDQIKYTVQAGDILSAGTYYWRCRAIDPKGSNSYGAWSTGDGSGYSSFVLTSGPPGIKTINDLAIASVKTINDTAVASVKTINNAA